MINPNYMKPGDDVIEVAISCVDGSVLSLTTREKWAYDWLLKEQHEGMGLTVTRAVMYTTHVIIETFDDDEKAYEYVKVWCGK